MKLDFFSGTSYQTDAYANINQSLIATRGSAQLLQLTSRCVMENLF